MGVGAKDQMVSNMNNTISEFKRLLGRTPEDPWLQDYIPSLPYTVCKRQNGGIGIKVRPIHECYVDFL